MGSVLLKLELITWNFCLLFLLPSWVWLLPSLDMAIMDMDMAMVMDMDMGMVTMDTMARGLLRLSLDMVIMVMDMVLDTVMDMAMVTMDIMARDLLMLSLLLLLSQDMDMAMDMAMDILATDMVVMDTMDIMVMDMVMGMAMDMVTATMVTMERDQLMLSQDMDIMVKQEPECCYFLEFSTTEVDQNRSSQNKYNF